MNRATQDFVHLHANDDVRQLALRKAPEDVDLRAALTQIEGRQLAVHKIPAWAAVDGLLFPSRLALEQCSSQATAAYKRALIQRRCAQIIAAPSATLVDLTGGLAVDFVALATLFPKARYVERNPELCELARHNFPLLNCGHAEVICEESNSETLPELTKDLSPASTILFIDPARRDTAGRKVALIEDCSPDLTTLQSALRSCATYVLIKLSPMLDLTAALRALTGIVEVHVVSVAGECKELLLLMAGESAKETIPSMEEIPIHCVDLPASIATSSEVETCKVTTFTLDEERSATMILADLTSESGNCLELGGSYLYEPNASLMKAGAFRTICQRFPVQQLSQQAHLYISDALIEDFPGRRWCITDSATFAKRDLRRLLANVTTADLTVRGFPMSVANLRKQLHLREGGNVHFIATTLADTRLLLKVEKV